MFLIFILNLLLPSFIYSEMNQKEIQNQTFWQWDLPSGSYRIHYIERGRGPRHVLLDILHNLNSLPLPLPLPLPY